MTTARTDRETQNASLLARSLRRQLMTGASVLEDLEPFVEEASVQPSFPALDTLISDVEAEAAKQPDMVALLSCVARLIIHSDADAYRVIGVLIEATATALDERMPLENRGAVAVETMRLLRDRLAERGVI